MSAAVRIRAVIVDGPLDDGARGAILAAMASSETEIVFALPSIAEVARHVAYETGIAAAVITGPQQHAAACRARFAVAWIAHRFGRHTVAQIGVVLRRDRATVSHAIARAQALRQRDAAFLALTDRVIEHLTGERP